MAGGIARLACPGNQAEVELIRRKLSHRGGAGGRVFEAGGLEDLSWMGRPKAIPETASS